MEDKTLADVVAAIKAMAERPDMSSPVYTLAHVAALVGCSKQHARDRVIKAPGFPPARHPIIGRKGEHEMRGTWARDEVIAWWESQPVALRESA